MKISTVIALTMISWLSLFAQSEPSFGYVTNIPNLLGFEEGKLNDIAEDWNGFIWLAREDGLYRYDGTLVNHYTQSTGETGLPHNRVFNILVDEERRVLWLGTAMGVSRLDPATGKTTNYKFDYENPNSIADNMVAHMHQDRSGNIWAGCFSHGLSLYQEETDDFKNFYFEIPEIDSLRQIYPTVNESRVNSFQYIRQDVRNDDLFWLGTPLGLVRFDLSSESFHWPFMEAPSKTNYLLKSVTRIYPFEKELLVGTWGKTYIYNITTGKIDLIHSITEEGTELEYVTNMYKRPEGDIRISYSNGLLSYDMENKQVLGAWADKPKLKKYFGIRYIDSEKRVWARSSLTTVLYDPLKQITKNYSSPALAFNSPKVFKKWDENTLILLNSKPDSYHLFNLNSHKWSSFPLVSKNIDWTKVNWNDLVKLDDHRCLLLNETEIYQLDTRNHTLQLYEVETGHNKPGFLKAIVDSRNYLWLGTQRVGLFRIDLSTGKTEHYIEELNSTSSTSLYTYITDLYEDKSRKIWIRLARSYAIYDPKSDQFQVFSHHQESDNTFRYIENFAEAPFGAVWIASMDEGIGRTDENRLQEGIVQKLSVEDGLLSNQIIQMALGKDERLWLLTQKGLSIFDPENLVFNNYTWDWGILKSDFFVPLSDGQIALALRQGGIGILDPKRFHSERAIPKPYITRITVKDSVIYEGGNRINLSEIDIKSGRDLLSFEFSALGYSEPKQFAYQLEGFDPEWVKTAGHSSASYSNLRPGQYIFRLQVKQLGGDWSEEAVLEVYLVPKWWETSWFQVIMAALLLFLGFRIYKWRVGNVKRKERIKAAYQRKLDEVEMQALRSQMNPHFLFNSLNSIQHYIIKNKQHEAVDYLGRFSRLVRLILQNSRSKMVPLADELEALQLYMELESLRFKVKFDHEIDISPSINPATMEIPPMLMQPFVENAIWHGIQHKGEKGNILVKIDRDEDQLICSIQDDGIGREAAKQFKRKSKKRHRSMGLKITKDRLEMLNHDQEGVASFTIVDLYDESQQAKGTKVVFRLPLV